MSPKSWTYEKAGVPPLKGDAAFEEAIVRGIRSTQVPGVMGSPTGFASLFDLKKARIRDPLLVSSTDGVGTKLEIARLLGKHDTIGIDLVAMCANDVLTTGARPVYFLDYFATGKFKKEVVREVLKGVVTGCRQAGCALVGGETAVMPGFYKAAANGKRLPAGRQGSPQYDLAGFCVGVVDRKKLITGAKIRKGDQLLGLESSGFHSNGFSLLRKIIPREKLAGKLGEQLLTPTRIYVKPVLALLKRLSVRGIANITGGGFAANLRRVIPKGLGATIVRGSWPRSKVFDLVRNFGNITDSEMAKTFNLGIGMVLIVAKRDAERARNFLARKKLKSWIVGEVTAKPKIAWITQ